MSIAQSMRHSTSIFEIPAILSFFSIILREELLLISLKKYHLINFCFRWSTTTYDATTKLWQTTADVFMNNFVYYYLLLISLLWTCSDKRCNFKTFVSILLQKCNITTSHREHKFPNDQHGKFQPYCIFNAFQ